MPISCVLVCDQSVPWSAEDQALRDQWPAAVLVHNKCDLPAGHQQRRAAGGVGMQPAGALRGDGIEALLETIGRRLVPDPPPPGAAVPFTAQQVEAIQALSAPAW